MACCPTTPSHDLNQCWHTLSWALRKNFQPNVNQNTIIPITGNVFETLVCKMSVILLRPQCVNSFPPSAAYVSVNCNNIGSDNGLSPIQHQSIIQTNAGILLIGPLGTSFSKISIKTFSLKKMPLKVLSAKWQPFCLGLNVLRSPAAKPPIMFVTAQISSNLNLNEQLKITVDWLAKLADQPPRKSKSNWIIFLTKKIKITI